jgi:hypothetical protein
MSHKLSCVAAPLANAQVAVVEGSSFAKAARQLGHIPQSCSFVKGEIPVNEVWARPVSLSWGWLHGCPIDRSSNGLS